MDLSNVNGFVAVGDPSNGVIPTTGGGTRLMWYGRKAALRAGRALNTGAGSGTWLCTSSRLAKTNFHALNGDDVLPTSRNALRAPNRRTPSCGRGWRRSRSCSSVL
jgi:hypothetical protein